jgi:hypothetical protein
MLVWVVVSHPTDDNGSAGVVGVYSTEENALAIVAGHDAKVKARKNSAERFWVYEATPHYIDD